MRLLWTCHMSNLDPNRLASAASGMVSDVEALIGFDLNAAIHAKDLKEIYDIAPRLAVLSKPELDVAYAKITAAFGKEARINELKARVRLEQSLLRQADHAAHSASWESQLVVNDKGIPKPCLENITLHLENSPEWNGVLGYNEFTAGYTILKSPPDPITTKVGAEIEDQFDTEATRWVERRGLMVRPDAVKRAIDAFARRNAYHPVRDFLQSLPAWDGVPRVQTWLHDYCGVESSDENPNVYAETVGTKFLISAIARIMQPGCKVDHMLILEGGQGKGKSTLASTLAGDEWFTDHLSDISSKDASMELRGRWIIEMGELSALGRTEIERVKSFITRRSETFRPPYGRRVITMQRQCVFIGSTNAETYLKDETGNRRFWPVRCTGKMDYERLKIDREQLWAEALRLYNDGVTWWPDDEKFIADATEQQKLRYVPDTWQDDIEPWLDNPSQQSGFMLESTRDYVTVRDVLTHCLLRPIGQRNQIDDNRVSRCLRAAGWKQRQMRINGALRRVYVRGEGDLLGGVDAR